jgi:hypothetical protein
MLGAPLAGQEAQPSPSASPSTVRVMPPAPVVDRTPRRVVVLGAPPAEGRSSVGAGRLKAWQAAALKDGEGNVLVDGAPRVIKSGDVIDGYAVKSIGPGRVVLERPGELAIITFDARGAARVRIVSEADPTRQKAMGLPTQ